MALHWGQESWGTGGWSSWMPQQPRWEIVEQAGNVPAAGRAQGDVTEAGDAHGATHG